MVWLESHIKSKTYYMISSSAKKFGVQTRTVAKPKVKGSPRVKTGAKRMYFSAKKAKRPIVAKRRRRS